LLRRAVVLVVFVCVCIVSFFDICPSAGAMLLRSFHPCRWARI
jgi:hypothetical protein